MTISLHPAMHIFIVYSRVVSLVHLKYFISIVIINQIVVDHVK